LRYMQIALRLFCTRRMAKSVIQTNDPLWERIEEAVIEQHVYRPRNYPLICQKKWNFMDSPNLTNWEVV